MVDLSTKYLGLTLPSPLVVSASPLSERLENIKRMEDAGAAAVVLYSLFEEQIALEQHELYHHLEYGTESFAEALTYFPDLNDYNMGPGKYLEHIRAAKEAVDMPVIASLNGYTLSGWTDFARQIEQAGADALELNIYNVPTNFDMTGAEIEAIYLQIVRAVKGSVSIPVAVKLSPFFSNMANMAAKLSEAGADGLVLFNRFYQPDIDLENLEVVPNVLLSTPQAQRLPLRWIAILYGRISADLAATSGVHQAEDALKMLMVGANVTMMASALIRNGIEHLQTVEAGIRNWLTTHEYESVMQMQGSMSQIKSGAGTSFERAQYMRAVSSLPGSYWKQQHIYTP
jgi:dihydroorotate dehydrogenase (fumarate)